MAPPIKAVGSKSEKLWRDAIMRAVHRAEAKGVATKRLEMLADKLVAIGLNGDVSAMKEIGDRLDGKPTQDMNVQSTVTVTPESAGLSELDAIIARATGRQTDTASEKPLPN